MKRLAYLDVARALSIILVVIGHYNQHDFPIWYQKSVLGIYTFHIPLFMFVSGYLYTLTGMEKGYCDLFWKKFRRLMIPYFVVSFIVISIKLLFQGHAYISNPVTPQSYLRMFCLPEAGYYLWFVWSLWSMFVIVPFFKTKGQRLLLFFLAVALQMMPLPEVDLFCLSQTKNNLVYFMLGVMASDHRERLVPLGRVPLVFYFMAFLSVEFLYAFFPQSMGRFTLLIAFLGITFMIQLSKCLVQKGGKMMVFCLMSVSSASYVIYLFHTTFEGFAKAVIHKMDGVVDCSQMPFFLLGFVFVVTLGIWMPILLNDWVLKRYKTTRFLFGLK